MKHTLYIVFFIIILAISGCKKDDVQFKEFKITSESVYKTTSTIVITVNYTYASVLQSVDGYISESSDMTNALHVQGEINKNTFVLTFNDLHVNTTYYYYYEYNNGIDVIKTAAKNVTTNNYSIPIVTTSDVSNITATFATCGGDVIDDGGLAVTTRGVCWGTSQNPTISDSHTTDDTGTGSFTSIITELNPNTTYYVRAYAINNKGISYGDHKTFQTLCIAPEGGINGLFSVSYTQSIYFSKGNLQYQASTEIWRFAEHQWDVIGDANSNISSNYNGWIDLFGWGTSGYNHGAICYQPWSTSSTYGYYDAYGRSTYNLNDQTGKADWGYNPISNGGNQLNRWRTLTKDEWVYVFNTRSTPSGIRYAKAKVNDVNGVILLPDDWNSSYTLNSTNTENVSFSSNIIFASQWNTLEQQGAVFLPAAGVRSGTRIDYVGSDGVYWSASYYDSNSAAYDMGFNDSHMIPSGTGGRGYGFSVRLVCNVH